MTILAALLLVYLAGFMMSVAAGLHMMIASMWPVVVIRLLVLVVFVSKE